MAFTPDGIALPTGLLTPSTTMRYRTVFGGEILKLQLHKCSRHPTSGQNSTPGGSSFNPHLGFAEVGMLLDSHFLLITQFLKYLQHDDLNVTTILIHIED